MWKTLKSQAPDQKQFIHLRKNKFIFKKIIRDI